MFVGVALLAGFAFCAFSSPGGVRGRLWIVLAWVVFALAYLVRLALWHALRQGHQPEARASRFDKLAWALPPVLLAMLAFATVMRVPDLLRFRLSRAQLSTAAGTPDGKWSEFAPGWIGLYFVERIDQSRGSVYFITGHDGWREPHGLAWCPQVPEDGAASYEPLGDGWYVWTSYHRRRELM